MKRLFTLPLLALALLAPACSRQPTSYEGRIYYTQPQRQTFQVGWTDPQGTGVHQILQDVQDPRSPSPDPDGKRLAYLQGSPPVLHVQSLVSGTDEQISQFKDSVSKASWSSVGGRLAYLHYPATGRAELVVQVPGREAQVVHKARQMGLPVWSSLGDRLYYAEADLEGGWSVWSRKSDGSEPEKVLDNATEPALSPDGNTLAVLVDGKLHTWLLREKKLAKVLDREGITNPTWSPSGKEIAFLSEGQVWAVGVDGQNPRQVTQVEGGALSDIAWGKAP